MNPDPMDFPPIQNTKTHHKYGVLIGVLIATIGFASSIITMYFLSEIGYETKIVLSATTVIGIGTIFVIAILTTVCVKNSDTSREEQA